MHQSSETIGAIAAALAKAQVELTNPEKSLVATIRGRDPRDGERTFRYAPLSSGLEIVRKSLGQQEIATIQTTSIDREAGLIRLSTVLAHSSGEWMSSEWPVCAIADASAPQRMGAALTYARRYALFTLVGIAGEDDLDAPDLPGVRVNGNEAPGPSGRGASGANAHAAPSATSPDKTHQAGSPKAPQPILGLEASARCRDRLLEKLAGLTTADELAVWAQRILPTKNTLRTEDAAITERAFTAKLEQLSGDLETADTQAADGELARTPSETVPAPGVGEARLTPPAPHDAAGSPAASVNPDMPLPDAHCAELAFGKTRRKRDKNHRALVASNPCLVCGRHPADAHHLRFAQPRALGRKVSDEFTVPLCRLHHRELHLRADEAAWWQEYKIDALGAAQRLWALTRGPSAEGATSRLLA